MSSNTSMYACPKCGNPNTYVERRPDGFCYCPYCHHRWKSGESQPKPTNGDKIIAGGMRAIAKFAIHHCCNNCIYFDGNNPYRSTCGKPDNETCEDGVEAWLNAPAESEVYNETTSN